MTPRDNLRALLRRQGYQYVPPFFSLCPDLQKIFHEKTGATSVEEYFGFPNRVIGFLGGHHALPPDWGDYYPEKLAPGTTFTNYGVAHEPGSAAARHMTRMRHPLQHGDSLEQLQAYPWPDFNHLDTAPLAARAREIHAAGLLPEAHMAMTIWETAWYIRGMEPLMMDMMNDDPKAAFLLDTITNHSCSRIAAYIEAGAEHVHIGDDVGTQRGLMISASMYREWLKPRLAKVIETARRLNPEVIVSYHSCGHVTPLIGDFIEAGIDVLNPVQPECMDFTSIHAEYGDRLSFWGTIGTQTTMPHSSPDEVRRLVWHHLDIAGPTGGLWPTPTHLLEPEVPWENIMAYTQACRDYAKY